MIKQIGKCLEGKEAMYAFLGGKEVAQSQFPTLLKMADGAENAVSKLKSLQVAKKMINNNSSSQDIINAQIDEKKGTLQIVIRTKNSPPILMLTAVLRGKDKSTGNSVEQVIRVTDQGRQFHLFRDLKVQDKVEYTEMELQYLKFGSLFPMQIQMVIVPISNETDIVCEHSLGAPKKEGGQLSGEILIVYNREVTGADYRYVQQRGSQDPFQLIIPVEMDIWVDKSKLPLQIIEDSEQTYARLYPGPFIHANMKDLQFTQVKEEAGKVCLRVQLKKEWGVPISQEKMEGEEAFRLDVGIGFKDREGKSHELSLISTENPSDQGMGRFFETFPIRILWGCIDDTALVLMADGKQKMLKNICIGDEIRGTDGRINKVKNTSWGDEELMRYIKAEEQEQGIRVTTDHPVMTEKGWKRAIELRKGDRIQVSGKDSCYSKIEEIYTEPYFGRVGNLELETPTGFFANGYGVGDFFLENQLIGQKKSEEALSKEIEEELRRFEKM